MKERHDPLSDAIFSIIMTLLVLKIHVPEIEHDLVSNMTLFHELEHLLPSFAIYFFSFAVLGSFWITHNITLGVFAKNFDRSLVLLNFGFLSIAGLIPFSAAIIASQPESKLAILIYSINILLLTLSLYGMRLYIQYSPSIQNPENFDKNFTPIDRVYATVRLLMNIVFAILAIAFSYIYIPISYIFLTIPIFYGLVPGSLAYTFKLLGVDKKYSQKSKIA